MADNNKILMTTDTLGGVWSYSMQLCRYLGKSDIEIHLAALGGLPSPKQEEEVDSLENVLLYKSNYRLEWMQNPWEDVSSTFKWLNCIYHTISPDLVHLNNFVSFEDHWSCPKITVFHSCVQSWWQSVKACPAPAEWDFYKKHVKNALGTSDVVVAPSAAILKTAKEIYHFNSDSRIIYNGLRLDADPEKGKKDFILCCGRIWDEGKNLKILSEIAENLPWPVLIAGDNLDPDTGERITFNNITFLGKLPPSELMEWMHEAAIFVSPSKYEPFGLAVLEAATAKCSLVLSDLDTHREIWGEDALYFDPQDSSKLERNLLDLIKKEEKRNVFGKKAFDRSRKYSDEGMGSAYLKLYREMLDKKNKKKLVSV